ncbi:MAG: Maf family protein [Thermoplasmata archaeon]
MRSRVILASGSPRRKELLARIVDDFEVVSSNIDECMKKDAMPTEVAIRNALEKARIVSSSNSDALVIGADTVVALDGTIIGKPDCPEKAMRILKSLSGRTHQVITGVAIVHAGRGIERTGSESTEVTFRDLSEEAIKGYVAAGTCLDKAGGYGIQDIGGEFVRSIAGDYDNAVGLPLKLISKIMGEMGKMMGS